MAVISVHLVLFASSVQLVSKLMPLIFAVLVPVLVVVMLLLSFVVVVVVVAMLLLLLLLYSSSSSSSSSSSFVSFVHSCLESDRPVADCRSRCFTRRRARSC